MKKLTGREVLLWSALLTAAVEAVTVVLRFGFKLQATRDTASTLGVLTFGVRVHHGYIGAALILVSLLHARMRPALCRWILVLGAALLCSDMIHHFAVLWPVVGSPEFHLLYPSP